MISGRIISVFGKKKKDQQALQVKTSPTWSPLFLPISPFMPKTEFVFEFLHEIRISYLENFKEKEFEEKTFHAFHCYECFKTGLVNIDG